MQKKKSLKIIIGSLVMVGILIIGFSFGYYLLNKVQDNNNIAGSKCFKLELSNEKNNITLDNMYPISDEEGRSLTPYSFTITNTCDMLAGYTVNMEMLEGTTLNSKYLDVMVNNEEIKLLNTYEETDTVIKESTESRILAKGTLAYNDSVDYTVRFWMDKDVEDIDSMNKYFASKIVINATPSSWNPKDAGYDTLHDAILANEYQTTPEDAIKKIKAKGTPDLSNTAPIIKWQEKIGEETTKTVIKPALSAIKSDDQTSELNENDTKIKLFTKISFDSDTATYTLSSPIFFDPSTINFDGDMHYYFISEGINYNKTTGKLFGSSGNSSRIIYEIKEASKESSKKSWNDIEYDSVTYTLNMLTLTSTELEVDNSDKGLYKDTDDYGTTYYFRGNVKNNNVYFAGFYWQIIRINGDGSIRLMYNGSEKNATGVKQSINNKTYQFNNLYNSPTYVGYMYGNPDGTTFDEVHTNTNSSPIKTNIDTWYKTNIIDNGYSDYISNAVGFCGDRTLYYGDGVSTNNYSYFGAYGRSQQKIAQFACPNTKRDLYTTADSSIGNKALTYPVGLITYDELLFSGMDNEHINKLSWTYSTVHYWTISPAYFYATGGYASEWRYNYEGYIAGYFASFSFGTRPVINLKSDVKISGGIGTSNDPFVIETT